MRMNGSANGDQLKGGTPFIFLIGNTGQIEPISSRTTTRQCWLLDRDMQMPEIGRFLEHLIV